ncbi:hypothetical protein [Solibacillus daqui]|uniref:hypothetical protein n=1 Tax=Solibacillus daqui TaxID=2912187 RepID=UPI002366A798|nr:hypothetical protein [Solibacillus daqui]
MKKYWSLIVIVTVIVATLATHYIQVASASNNNYRVTFEKITGDERYVNNLAIEGNIQRASNYHYSPFLITNGEMKAQRYSFYERPTSLMYKQLIDEHKSFMRGKVLDANRFYEDEEQLIYVSVPENVWELAVGDNLTYKVDILNKADDSVQSFTVESILKSPANWIILQHIEILGNDLKLVMNHASEMSNEEVHLTTIDLKSKQVTSDTIIEKIHSDEAIRTSINFYSEYNNLASEKYLVYGISEYDANLNQYKVLSQRFKVLNLETNEVQAFDVPKEMLADESRMVVRDHQFIRAGINDGKIIVNRYNLGHKEWGEPFSLDAPYEVLPLALFNMQWTNDKLYISAQAAEGQLLFIIDAESGETLYSGLIKPISEQHNFALAISQVYEELD